MTTGKLILLNGTRCSGRTLISQALPALLVEPYLTVSIEQFLAMVPQPIREHWLAIADRSALGAGRVLPVPAIVDEVVADMYHAIGELLSAGHNVIVAHMLLTPQWLRACALRFSTQSTLLVGVRCPLAVVEQRATHRGQGCVAQVRTQFELVHTHCVYDLEVDTSLLSPQACALQIQQRMRTDPPPLALGWLKAWSAPDKHRGWLRVTQEENDGTPLYNAV